MRDERVARLLDAVLAVTGDIQLETVLRRVVEAATSMVGARYGALGVLADDGEGLAAFVNTGLDDAAVARIGRLPEGRGILGVLIAHPEPLRLDDLRDHPASFGFPPGHPPMHAFLGAPIRVRDEVFGNLYLTEKEGGGSFTTEDEEMVVGLAAVAGAAISNARLVDDLRRREDWRSAVLEVTTSVLSGEAAHLARRRVAEAARQLIGGTGAAIVARDGGIAQVIASVGDAPDPGPVPADAPVGEVLERGIALGVDRSLIFPGAAAWVPLRERDEVVAALGVGRPAPFPTAETDQLALFASQASLALAHDRVSSDLRRLELIEDRERIGRDLHDTVIQRLFATGLSLQGTARLAQRPEVAARIQEAVEDLDLTVKHIRTVIFGLETAAARGGGTGLRERIMTLAGEARGALGFLPEVLFEGAVDTLVDDEAGRELLATLREALSNVARHAAASKVEVTVSAGDELVLRVTDDGRGLPPDRSGGGLGLRNMASRAGDLGGSFTARPAAGGGTVVEWAVPLGGVPS